MSFTQLTATTAIERLPTILNESMRSARFLNRVAKTATFTVWAGDVAGTPEDAYSCTSGPYAATLVAADATDAAAGRLVRVKNNGASTITITPDGSDTIENLATLILTAGQAATLLSDGSSNWEIY